MSGTADVEIYQQCTCIMREIRMRERVYPRLVARRQMTQTAADDELAAMRAVLTTLRDVARAQAPQQELLG